MNYVTAHDIPPTHEDWQKLPAHEGIIITQFAQEMESLGLTSWIKQLVPWFQLLGKNTK